MGLTPSKEGVTKPPAQQQNPTPARSRAISPNSSGGLLDLLTPEILSLHDNHPLAPEDYLNSGESMVSSPEKKIPDILTLSFDDVQALGIPEEEITDLGDQQTLDSLLTELSFKSRSNREKMSQASLPDDIFSNSNEEPEADEYPPKKMSSIASNTSSIGSPAIIPEVYKLPHSSNATKHHTAEAKDSFFLDISPESSSETSSEYTGSKERTLTFPVQNNIPQWSEEKKQLRRKTFAGKTSSDAITENVTEVKAASSIEIAGFIKKLEKSIADPKFAIIAPQLNTLKALASAFVEKLGHMTWPECKSTITSAQNIEVDEDEVSHDIKTLVSELRTKFIFICSKVCRVLDTKEDEETDEIDVKVVKEKLKTLSLVDFHRTNSSPKPVSSLSSNSASNATSSTHEVCRICDSEVLSELLDLHTPYCEFRDRLGIQLDKIDTKLKDYCGMMKTLIEDSKAKLKSEAPETAKKPAMLLARPKRQLDLQTQPKTEESKKEKKEKRLQNFMMNINFIVDKSAQLPMTSQALDELTQQINDVNEALHKHKHSWQLENCYKLTVDMLGTMKEKYELLQALEEALFDYQESLVSSAQFTDEEILKEVAPNGEKSHVHKTSITDFAIVKPIARGAFGKVFLAKKEKTGDIYCIKVISKAQMKTRNQMTRIQREQSIMTLVDNPFVVKLFYSFQNKNNLYLVMEYMIGGDLISLLEQYGALDEQICRFYIAETVLALEHIHSQGIIHRDIKPDNILIDANGHVKLADFGLSRSGIYGAFQNKDAKNRNSNVADDLFMFKNVAENTMNPSLEVKNNRRQFANSYVGTPEYTAPEVLLGTGHSFEVDFWSLGVVLFELLTGEPPFIHENVEGVFKQIINGAVPWPHLAKAGVSMECTHLLRQLLVLNPEKRLGSKGTADIKQHPFFADVNWANMLSEPPPFVPKNHTKSDTDLTFFSTTNRPVSLEDLVNTKEKCVGFGDCESCPKIHCDDKVDNFTYKNTTSLSSKNDLKASGQHALMHTASAPASVPQKGMKTDASVSGPSDPIFTSLPVVNANKPTTPQ